MLRCCCVAIFIIYLQSSNSLPPSILVDGNTFLEKVMSTYWTTSTMLEYLLGRYGLIIRIPISKFQYYLQCTAWCCRHLTSSSPPVTTSSKSQKSDEYELNRYHSRVWIVHTVAVMRIESIHNESRTVKKPSARHDEESLIIMVPTTS